MKGLWTGLCLCATASVSGAPSAGAPRTLLAGPDICPLPDAARLVAVDTFQRMMPVFLHDRCANCHGAIDVFAPDAEQKHGGRRIEPGNAESCDNCHDVPNWKQPAPQKDVGFAGKTSEAICRQLKRTRTPLELLRHIGQDPLIAASFDGRRGIYRLSPQPPPMTYRQFEQLISAWLGALRATEAWPDGGLSDCGCTPPRRWSGSISWSGDVGAGIVGLGQSTGSIRIELEPRLEPTASGDPKLYLETVSGTAKWRAQSRWTGPSYTASGAPCALRREGSDSGSFALAPGSGPTVMFGVDPRGTVGPERYMLLVQLAGEPAPTYKVRESGCGWTNDTEVPVGLVSNYPVGGVMQPGSDVLEGEEPTPTGYKIKWKLSRVSGGGVP